MPDSLFVVRNEDGPWSEDVMLDMVADTPHFRYLMAQSARGEAIKCLEKAKEYAKNSGNAHDRIMEYTYMAETWTKLAATTEMNLHPTEYQNRKPRYDSEPQDGVNNV